MSNQSDSFTHMDVDIEKGISGESIFENDYLRFLNMSYTNVTKSPVYQSIDIDYISDAGTFDIKNSYRDNKIIIIEDYTNVNTSLGDKSYGWFYKSQAETIVFISEITRAMILVPFTKEFKNHYENIKNDFRLQNNKISINRNGDKWQSAYRRIPLRVMDGYFAYYKKVG